MRTPVKHPIGSTLRSSLPAGGALALALLLAACSGGGENRRARGDANAACGPAGPTLAGPAVREYLKLQTDPYPQRFLVAAATDSALPDPGVLALQDKGPTYFFPPDTGLRAQVRAKLADVGSYNTLLVSYKGMEQPAEDTAVLRLGGTYIGGTHEGKTAPVRAMRFACDSTGWRFDRAEDVQGS